MVAGRAGGIDSVFLEPVEAVAGERARVPLPVEGGVAGEALREGAAGEAEGTAAGTYHVEIIVESGIAGTPSPHGQRPPRVRRTGSADSEARAGEAPVAARRTDSDRVIVEAVVAGTGGAELVAVCEHGTGEAGGARGGAGEAGGGAGQTGAVRWIGERPRVAVAD